MHLLFNFLLSLLIVEASFQPVYSDTQTSDGIEKKITPKMNEEFIFASAEISLQSIYHFFETLIKNSELENKESAVTTLPSGGRFGDQLVTYACAKWISYKNNIPLLYKNFPFSEQLVLDDVERPFTKTERKKYKKARKNIDHNTLIDSNAGPILYRLSYFPPYINERIKHHDFPYIDVDWEDPGFKEILKSLIKPKKSYATLELPKDSTTVALHVRRGTGYDPEAYLYEWPLKFPPLHFYVDQIRLIGALFPNKPLYVYIFSDTPEVQIIAKTLQEALKDLDVSFHYRTEGNHESFILDDFFAMTQFDCLIRPQSNFSFMAAKIADFTVEVWPSRSHKTTKEPIIDQVEIKYNLPKADPCL